MRKVIEAKSLRSEIGNDNILKNHYCEIIFNYHGKSIKVKELKDKKRVLVTPNLGNDLFEICNHNIVRDYNMSTASFDWAYGIIKNICKGKKYIPEPHVE